MTVTLFQLTSGEPELELQEVDSSEGTSGASPLDVYLSQFSKHFHERRIRRAKASARNADECCIPPLQYVQEAIHRWVGGKDMIVWNRRSIYWFLLVDCPDTGGSVFKPEDVEFHLFPYHDESVGAVFSPTGTLVANRAVSYQALRESVGKWTFRGREIEQHLDKICEVHSRCIEEYDECFPDLIVVARFVGIDFVGTYDMFYGTETLLGIYQSTSTCS